TILLGLPEDIYAAVDSCETAQEIWLRKEVDELKAERIAKTQDPLALMANSNNPYVFPAPHQDQSSFNQNYLQQSMPNPKDITDPINAMNIALALMAKAFKLNYSTPTNNNQRISSNLRNRQIAQPSMNIGQDRQMQMVGGNGGNQFRQYAGQNAGNPAGIAFSKPQREETYQVTLDALKLTPCYPTFLITVEVPQIYMHQFYNTIKKIRNSDAYNFKLDKKKCRVDTEVFHEILHQEFMELPSEEELLSFIKELGYSGKCDMLSVIRTDQMHQPWRTFAAIIN
nr:hypothetical protein [Tanacetum cinerariifolium]